MTKPICVFTLLLSLFSGVANAAFISHGESLQFSFNSCDLVYVGESTGLGTSLTVGFAATFPFLVYDEKTDTFIDNTPTFSDSERFYSNESVEVSFYEDIDSQNAFRTEQRSGTDFGGVWHVFSPSVCLLDFITGSSSVIYAWQDLDGFFEITMLSGDAMVTEVSLSIDDGTSSYMAHFDVASVPLPASVIFLFSGLIPLLLNLSFGDGLKKQKKCLSA